MGLSDADYRLSEEWNPGRKLILEAPRAAGPPLLPHEGYLSPYRSYDPRNTICRAIQTPMAKPASAKETKRSLNTMERERNASAHISNERSLGHVITYITTPPTAIPDRPSMRIPQKHGASARASSTPLSVWVCW
ncbi:hypothetical protein B2J93_4650 [Marssonina coronariae]|uniref:Uncharacterized protein n=1 Tax=Diplocarpon coronariae TaxID=2795749 RepID=A0A218YVQ9_9HELO|nr:hypothetical protein B2J93_4650 [Marssonina coronariae]